MVPKVFSTFIVVAAILASLKRRDFTWSYRSSIYRVHCPLKTLPADNLIKYKKKHTPKDNTTTTII